MPRTPTVPKARSATARARILEALEVGVPVTLKELSGEVGLSERDLPAHLQHLQRSLKHQGKKLFIEPASCLDCGFVFRDRDRFTRPGKCPECRGTHLEAPRVGLAERSTTRTGHHGSSDEPPR